MGGDVETEYTIYPSECRTRAVHICVVRNCCQRVGTSIQHAHNMKGEWLPLHIEWFNALADAPAAGPCCGGCDKQAERIIVPTTHRSGINTPKGGQIVDTVSPYRRYGYHVVATGQHLQVKPGRLLHARQA